MYIMHEATHIPCVLTNISLVMSSSKPLHILVEPADKQNI